MVGRLTGARAGLALVVDTDVAPRGPAYRYGLPAGMRGPEPLPLPALNPQCAAAEKEGSAIAGPGLPAFCEGDERFSSDDCLEMPGGYMERAAASRESSRPPAVHGHTVSP